MKDSIILYSSPTCPKCRMLKMELGKKNLQFEECQDTEVMKPLGIQTLPVLSINGELFGMQAAIKWIKERA